MILSFYTFCCGLFADCPSPEFTPQYLFTFDFLTIAFITEAGHEVFNRLAGIFQYSVSNQRRAHGVKESGTYMCKTVIRGYDFKSTSVNDKIPLKFFCNSQSLLELA